MATIMPQGELMRRAVKWIEEQRVETGQPAATFLDKAALQFNLGPKDADFLTAFFREQQGPDRD